MTSDLMNSLQGGFLLRLGIDLVAVAILVRGIYFRAYRRTDYFLPFFALNLIIFLVSYVLNQVEISLGAAFGLFAVFSMLRYRTEGISTTDMTYLFTAIALGLLLAVSVGSAGQLLLFAGVILVTFAFLESRFFASREVGQKILYDRIDLLGEKDRAVLLADLRARTGLEILRVEVREIDLVRDSATLTIYLSV
jgi:hypothetical protein